MTIDIKGTNVVVLYGDAAVQQYAELINRWSGMVPGTQWDSFQFILAGTRMPSLQLNENARTFVHNGNTRYYDIEKDAAPRMGEYHNLIFDHIQKGNLHLHTVVAAGEEPLSFSWLKEFLQSARQVTSLPTVPLYYLLFGRNSAPAAREALIDILNAAPGTAFFITDTQENGGRVPDEERWHAVELGMLMNCCEALPIPANACSFGYSALNANGSELRILRESMACAALREELSQSIDSLAEIDAYMGLLPEGVSSLPELGKWLEEKARKDVTQPKPSAWKNAFITTQFSHETSPGEAISRMKRFADLNYAANEDIRGMARALARHIETQVRQTLCDHPATACLAPEVMETIAAAFRQMSERDPQPGGCAYPQKPFMLRFGKGVEEYEAQCRKAVQSKIEEYILTANRSVYAAEMEQAYLRLAAWLRSLREDERVGAHRQTAQENLQEFQGNLDGSDGGNARRLGVKYKAYRNALADIRPSLAALTEGIRATYYHEDGRIMKGSWKTLVTKAANNMERKLPASFKGDFFKVLSTEFDTPEERGKFFDEFLQSGPCMYNSLSANITNGVPVLLADKQLMEQWTVDREIYEVHTDNAESLTVYPLGTSPAAEYLEDRFLYFHPSEGDNLGRGIFDGQNAGSGKDPFPGGQSRRSGRDLFGGGSSDMPRPERADEQENQPAFASYGKVQLIPDEKNEYRLSWPWHGNDQTAMVEMFQAGDRIGKVAVIPVGKFLANGGNMNVSTDIMGGKVLPMGLLTVTIRGADKDVFLADIPVQGRRQVVRYKITGTRLQLRPENSEMVKQLVLRTIEADGTRIDYPLYYAPSWLYEGLSINNGKIAADSDQIYPVLVE